MFGWARNFQSAPVTFVGAAFAIAAFPALANAHAAGESAEAGLEAGVERQHHPLVHVERPAVVAGQPGHVGRIGHDQQVDAPQVLYERPRNLFVAAFIGSPAMNLVEAELNGDSLSFAGFTSSAASGMSESLGLGVASVLEESLLSAITFCLLRF